MIKMFKMFKKLISNIGLIEKPVVLIFVLVYSVGASIVSVLRYRQFSAFWYDYGILDETIWKLAHFKPPIIISLNPPVGMSAWGDHFRPSIILLTPFYWITDNPEVTLVAQVIFVSLSALIFYVISRKIVESSIARMAIVVSYLGFVGMQNALFTDIHPIVFALLPISLVFWSIYERKWLLYWIFLLITFGFQENLAGLGLGVGFYLILRQGKNIKLGLVTILFSLFYGFISTKFIIPFFSGGNYSYSPTIPEDLSWWIKGLFYPLDLKFKAIKVTFATFGFLPLFSIPTYPLILGHYLERFVLNLAGTRWDLGFHYNAPLSSIMTVAIFEVLTKIQRSKLLNKFIPVWAFLTILVVVFIHRFYYHGPLLLAHHPVFYEQTKRSDIQKEFIEKIPKQGLIMAQNNLAAHLTHYNVTLLNDSYEEINPDWIAVDIGDGQNANNFFPIPPDIFKEMVASISASPNYSKYLTLGNQILFKNEKKRTE